MEPESFPDENDRDITTCIGQLAERCFELGEPSTATVLMTLKASRLANGSVHEFSDFARAWAFEELIRMENEKKKSDDEQE